MRELPASAWEQYLVDNDAVALLALLQSLPTRKPLREATYPIHHRLCDIELGGRGYRVTRLVDLDDGRERLFIEPTDVPHYGETGVPYWLQGSGLIRWIRDEEALPTDDEIDWESYRTG
jgi:hypothetical protein